MGAYPRVGAYSRGCLFERRAYIITSIMQEIHKSNIQELCYIVPFTSSFYAQITNKLSITYPCMHYILLICICVIKFKMNIRIFRRLKGGRLFEGWSLIRRGCLLDISVSRVGAYCRGRLFEGVLKTI